MTELDKIEKQNSNDATKINKLKNLINKLHKENQDFQKEIWKTQDMLRDSSNKFINYCKVNNESNYAIETKETNSKKIDELYNDIEKIQNENKIIIEKMVEQEFEKMNKNPDKLNELKAKKQEILNEIKTLEIQLESINDEFNKKFNNIHKNVCMHLNEFIKTNYENEKITLNDISIYMEKDKTTQQSIKNKIKKLNQKLLTIDKQIIEFDLSFKQNTCKHSNDIAGFGTFIAIEQDNYMHLPIIEQNRIKKAKCKKCSNIKCKYICSKCNYCYENFAPDKNNNDKCYPINSLFERYCRECDGYW